MYSINTLIFVIAIGVRVNCVEIKFENVLTSRHGLGWPPTLHVAEGNEALMKLSLTLENQQSCNVTTPSGETFEVTSPPASEYQRWSDGCGVRVRQVKQENEGRWRLTASGNNSSLTGWIELYVIDGVERYQPPPIVLKDGETQATVQLTSLENAYCVVAKPFTESSLVPGHCALTLDRTTRSVQGNWDILLGLPGQVAEIRTTQAVAVEAERLSTGYMFDSNEGKLHLYCNILHTTKNLTFCRFQRTSNAYGFNVVDGLSDGSHSYYGEGFALKQCGMTIEHPTAADYGTWRCSVGVSTLVNNHVTQETPMQALISIQSNPRSINLARMEESDEKRVVFVQENTEFTITCRADFSLSYCWFQHPNGTQFTPVALSSENQQFWYTGESLAVGDCGIMFATADASDNGNWICHMGPTGIGVEETDRVELRVTGPLAANKKEIPVSIGGMATLFCHSSNGNRPLKYCRFLTPTNLGFNINSSVTEDLSILDRYYFTPERDLAHGHCSINIKGVMEEDIGEWTCAAVVDNDSEESRDTIVLFIDSVSAPRFRAGVFGMAFGLSALLVVIVGFVLYKRNWIPHINLRRRNQSTVGSTVTESFSLPTRSSVQYSISSESSSEVSTQDEIRRP